MHQWWIKTPLFQCPELRAGMKQLEVASNTPFWKSSDWSTVANKLQTYSLFPIFFFFFNLRFVTCVTNSAHFCQAVGTEPGLTMLCITQFKLSHACVMWLQWAYHRHTQGSSQTQRCFCSSAWSWLSWTLFWRKRHVVTSLKCSHENNNPEKWAAKMRSGVLNSQSKPAALKIFVITWFDPAGSCRQGKSGVLHFW